MALFGVVFALGAGSAFAQLTVTDPKTVNEGGRVTFTVTAKVNIASAATAATVTVTATGSAGTADATKMLTAAETADYVETATGEIVIPAAAPGATEIRKYTTSTTVTLQTNTDNDSEDEALSVAFTIGGDTITGQNATAITAVAPASRNITIKDLDEQEFVMELDPGQTPEEGGTATLTLRAKPAPVELTYDAAVAVDTPGYTVSPSNFQFADGTTSTPLTVTAPGDDKNREDDEVTVTALKAGTVDELTEPVEIEFADQHGLPDGDDITAKAFTIDAMEKKTKIETTSVMEGGDPVYITVSVDRGKEGYPVGEGLNVALMAVDGSQALDYRLEMSKVSIASGTGEKTADVKLWALADDDVGAEALTFNLVATGATTTATSDGNGKGQSVGMFSIMIADATVPMVSVKDDAYDAIQEELGEPPMLYKGMSGDLMTGDLFDYDPDMVNVAFAASTDSGAVSVSTSGYMVNVMAVEATPMDEPAKVTVTATATPKASSLEINQTVSNVAQLTFPVVVGLEDLVVMLSIDEDMMNIAEGMGAMITATANRPVEMDTTVELIQTEGTASPADYEHEPLMIMADETVGTTMLMAVEDEMMEEGETLTLEGRFAEGDMGGSMKTGTVMFYIWDAAVPALPLIAQLLLAAFLAIGGYRRYLRR